MYLLDIAVYSCTQKQGGKERTVIRTEYSLAGRVRHGGQQQLCIHANNTRTVTISRQGCVHVYFKCFFHYVPNLHHACFNLQ